ncbi:hypothetical protein [Streptomyces marianii]|uniref:Uncharacterized protein n=1 Tax=Streptomyces marianii TaxID=1817406 RepID=A0A5R9EAI0_9ACTN|nr:hypothetical protein [Streptomyces marianii]TLQ45792.1 hypothetical protein FEF34_24850 [Streptomyces marianii]
MNARRVNAAAGVIFAAMKTRQTAAGIAAALEAAQLLQSPETADELQRLRARVAELEHAPIPYALTPMADAVRQRLADRSWEDPHDSPLHRAHCIPHDMPLIGGGN